MNNLKNDKNRDGKDSIERLKFEDDVKLGQIKKTIKGLARRFENVALLEENMEILEDTFYYTYNLNNYNLNYHMLTAMDSVVNTLRKHLTRTKLKRETWMEVDKNLLIVLSLYDRFSVLAISQD